VQSELERQLATWVTAVCGENVEKLSLIPGGASRRSFNVLLGNGEQRFLRVDTGEGPLSGTEMNLDRERRFTEPVAALGVLPIPRIIAFNPHLNALLMEHIDGYTSYTKTLAPEQQRSVERALVAAIARLHQLDVAELQLPDHANRATISAAITAALEMWGELYRNRVTAKDPVTSYALSWLEANIPGGDQPSVLVHGDVGPGNFLFSEAGELRALIDWELAHIGHPLEDLACIICRSLGVDFGAPEQLINDYEAASASTVDRRQLDYAIVLVLTEWSVGISMALSRPSVNQDMAMLFFWGHVNRYELMRILARLAGKSMPALPALQAPGMEWDFLSDHVTGVLEEIVLPGTEDSYLQYRLRALVQLQKAQQALLQYGVSRYQQEDQAWAEDLTDSRYDSYEAAMMALLDSAGAAAVQRDERYMDYLLWRTARERLLLFAGLGAMTDRRINY
jgi:aminoglycoside phosphotransferase (APT) family kinase protein